MRSLARAVRETYVGELGKESLEWRAHDDLSYKMSVVLQCPVLWVTRTDLWASLTHCSLRLEDAVRELNGFRTDERILFMSLGQPCCGTRRFPAPAQDVLLFHFVGPESQQHEADT